jgi:hypothetical protein
MTVDEALDELSSIADCCECVAVVRDELDRLRAEVADGRKLLLQFIASLTLADHMGDAMNEADTVLERIGYVVQETEGDELEQLQYQLSRDRVTTLHGTLLAYGVGGC